MHVCSSCHAPIVWCETTQGKRMPVDEAPTPGGSVRVIARKGSVPLARVVGCTIDMFDPTDDGVRHLSHFVHCPDAADWRQ